MSILYRLFGIGFSGDDRVVAARAGIVRLAALRIGVEQRRWHFATLLEPRYGHLLLPFAVSALTRLESAAKLFPDQGRLLSSCMGFTTGGHAGVSFHGSPDEMLASAGFRRGDGEVLSDWMAVGIEKLFTARPAQADPIVVEEALELIADLDLELWSDAQLRAMDGAGLHAAVVALHYLSIAVLIEDRHCMQAFPTN